jgi:hypothetical protein
MLSDRKALAGRVRVGALRALRYLIRLPYRSSRAWTSFMT